MSANSSCSPAQYQSSICSRTSTINWYLAIKADPLPSAIRPRDQHDPHDDAHPEGENRAKRQKTLQSIEAYYPRESLSRQIPTNQVTPRHHGGDIFKTIDEVNKKENSCISTCPRKITPLVQSCQRDPEAPALSLINQDLLYLKKGNSGPEKIVLSLHKFPEIVFNDDDIEERTSRWVNKCIKKFNSMPRYGDLKN
ncbi:hypothetical protein Tco_0442377 [Tanacetum coccineum]